MKMMTLDEVETKIYNYYQWFAKNEPGVRVQEAGDLAKYWAVADYLIEQEGGS